MTLVSGSLRGCPESNRGYRTNQRSNGILDFPWEIPARGGPTPLGVMQASGVRLLIPSPWQGDCKLEARTRRSSGLRNNISHPRAGGRQAHRLGRRTSNPPLNLAKAWPLPWMAGLAAHLPGWFFDHPYSHIQPTFGHLSNFN